MGWEGLNCLLNYSIVTQLLHMPTINYSSQEHQQIVSFCKGDHEIDLTRKQIRELQNLKVIFYDLITVSGNQCRLGRVLFITSTPVLKKFLSYKKITVFSYSNCLHFLSFFFSFFFLFVLFCLLF